MSFITKARACALALTLPVLTAGVLVAPPADAEAQVPSTFRRAANFESTLNLGTDGWNLTQAGFAITRTSERGGTAGPYAAKIVSTGGNSGCGCPRMKFEDGFRHGAGKDIWIRGSWYIPQPSQLSWSRLMNLSSYTDGSSNNHLLGLVIPEAGKMQVVSQKYGGAAKVLIPSRSIPTGRWFTVHLHVKLGRTNGAALTEMYLDGVKVGSTTAANMATSQAYNVYQAGLPNLLYGIKTTVYFDNPGLKD
jgi:hypothetical protein